MRITYESFDELSKVFTKGEGIFHGVKFNKHDPDPCIAWQQGAKQFAEMLDKYVDFPEYGVELKDCFVEHKRKIKIIKNK